MDETTQQESKTKTIDLQPLKKGRRVLLFLADFFLVFMIAVSLYHIAVYPLGKAIVDFSGQQATMQKAQTDRDSVLYEKELLFPRSPGLVGYAEFQENYEFTAKEYIHCLVDPGVSAKYEVFATYFKAIRGDNAGYMQFYRDLDARYGFFDFGTDTVSLKANYVEEFIPAFDTRDEMSEQGQKDYNTFNEKIVLQGYARLLNDINEKDLVSSKGISYKTQQATVNRIINNFDTLIVTCAIVSYFLGSFLNFVIIPLLSKKRKTIAMMAMRIERVKKKNLDILSMPQVYLNAIYSIAAEALTLLFIPLGTVAFNELFSLPGVFILALFSFVYIIASLVTLLIDPFNRTLSDLLTQIHCLGAEEFDELIRAKGYDA